MRAADRTDYIVRCLIDAASMYEEDAKAFLAEHDADHRAQIIAERDTEIVAWLGKKAREYRSTGSKQRALQADAIDLMASKLARGAVRANNLLGAVTRPDVLREAAAVAESIVGLFEDSDEGAAAAGAMEGLAIRLRRMADAGQAASDSQPDTDNTTPPADFFQPGHGYTHRSYGNDFHCVTVTTHPTTGERLAMGWLSEHGDWHRPTVVGINQWNHEYDGAEPPDDHGSIEDAHSATELYEMDRDAEFRHDAEDDARNTAEVEAEERGDAR